MTTTHAILAQSVKALHKGLDHHPLLAPLISRNINRDAYLRAMALLQRCLMRTEPALAEFERSTDPLALDNYIPKARSIDYELGEAPIALDFSTAAMEPLLTSSLGAYIGVRYVLEGASQGGRFIKANLLSVFPDFSSPYWDLQEKSAKKWPQFLHFMGRLDEDKSERQRAIQASIMTFNVFIDEFDRAGQ